MSAGPVLLIERGCTLLGSWRSPGECVRLPGVPHRLEEARRLVRQRFAVPANLRSLELLGDCRPPKQRAKYPAPLHLPGHAAPPGSCSAAGDGAAPPSESRASAAVLMAPKGIGAAC